MDSRARRHNLSRNGQESGGSAAADQAAAEAWLRRQLDSVCEDSPDDRGWTLGGIGFCVILAAMVTAGMLVGVWTAYKGY
jgi:hypothetical protein